MHKTLGFREIALTATLLSFFDASENLEANPSIAYRKFDETKKTDEKIQAVAAYTDALTVQTVEGSLAAVNPPHRELNTGFFANADVLYMRASEDNLNFATLSNITETIIPGISVAAIDKQKTLEPHFTWNWGGRASLGYQFENFDSWDLYLNGMYVHGKAKNSGDPSHQVPSVTLTAAILDPTWGGAPGVNFGGFFVDDTLGLGLTQASADWMMNLYTIDLELGRSFYIGRKVSLRPFAGFRGAFLDQKYTAYYSSVYDLSATSDPAPSDILINVPGKMKAHNNFQGFGLRGGFDFLWHFLPNWGFDALCSGSLLYGEFNVKQDYTSSTLIALLEDEGFIVGPFPTKFVSKRKPHRIRCNLEGAIGMFWEANFNKDKNHVFLGVYYEVAEWFDQNEMTRTFIDLSGIDTFNQDGLFNVALDDTRRNYGNIGLSGMSLKLRFDF